MADNISKKHDFIWKKLDSGCHVDLLPQTRIHPLRSFGSRTFMKREDDSSFGISGTKMRKLASIFQPFSPENPPYFLLIGGSSSNHIVAMTQKINELGGDFRLFLKEGSAKTMYGGNAFLIRLLAQQDKIYWIAREDWHQAEQIAQTWQAEHAHPTWEIIPEGGYCQAGVVGASTLLFDIIRNENQHSGAFDHIWIDSGTGLSAACLVAMNALLERRSVIHVVLMAGDEAYFKGVYQQVRTWLSAELNISPPPLRNYQLHIPPSARSFGSINAQVLTSAISFARNEGILADPIYTAKLLLTSQELILRHWKDESHLIIHGGGGTGLMGFAGSFEKYFS